MSLHSNQNKGDKVVEELGEASEDRLDSNTLAEGGEGTAEGDGEAAEEGKKVIQYRSKWGKFSSESTGIDVKIQ